MVLTTPVGFRTIMNPVTLALQTVAPTKLESMFYEERASFDPEKSIDLLSDAQGALGCLRLKYSTNATPFEGPMQCGY